MVRLGAEKVFAIGVRCGKKGRREEIADGRNPSLAQVMGVAFDVMFLDHLDTDIEHLERLNRLLKHDQIHQPEIEGAEKMRPLTTFVITPSVHLSAWPVKQEGTRSRVARQRNVPQTLANLKGDRATSKAHPRFRMPGFPRAPLLVLLRAGMLPRLNFFSRITPFLSTPT